MQENDTVAFVGITDVYRFYFDATANGTRALNVGLLAESDVKPGVADWILAQSDADFSGDGYTRAAVSERDSRIGSKPIILWQARVN